ncbi:MAG: outer membrane beta-barrel protein, partial [Lentimicrobium sp.]|nr:outer membrane beta-barrel protein [Lentimicrobium sp.]
EVENTTHNAPLTLGLLISRQIGKKWNLETGLVYTKLGYQIETSEINQTYHEYRSEIYYLGIPLGVRFGIIDRKRFGIYAAQSLIIEKGIAGRTYNDTYNQGLLTGSENNSVSIRGIQLSSLTGIGADLRIAPKISLYGQTGLQLFFMNASQPYNIRSARVAWPSFQLGLRVKIIQNPY